MHDLRRLRAFRAVAERRSFSAAALDLGYAQSVVSHHVGALEREFGVTLVDRSSRPVALTDAGERLLAHAVEVLGHVAAAEEELRAIAGVQTGLLRVGAFSSACTSFVPAALGRFEAQHPGVEVRLEALETEPALQRLRAGELDLAVVYDFPGIPGGLDEGLDTVHLIDDRYDLLVARDHPLAEKRRVRMGELADERWVNSTQGCGCRQAVFHACAQAGFEPRVAFETDEILSVQALVANGMGVTLMPQLALTAVHPGVAVRPLGREAPMRHIYAARMRDAYRSPATQAMLQLLVDMAEEFRPDVAPVGDEAVVAA
jgi:DNA-binding transcriptional LysR family regulator